MPRRPRPWRGSLRAHKGWILITVKDERGEWVERSTQLEDTPENWPRARRLLADLREQLRAREDATGSTAALTVDAWAKRWIATRTNRDRANDEARLRLHVLPALGAMLLEEVKPRHLAELARAWQAKAPRTRRNIYSVTKALFRDARIAGLLDGPDPCILTHRQIGKIRDAKGFVRREAIYTRDELEALVSDPRVPSDRRVWYALLGLAMLRTGEAAGLRWSCLEPAAPLSRMVVETTYDFGDTKTGETRYVPVLPALAALLAEWKLGGWARAFGRPPAPEDLVVPVTPEPPRKGRTKPPGSMRDRHYARKRLLADLARLTDAAGTPMRHRRAHDLRRTGISLAQDDGADRAILRWATHAPPREIMDLYTTHAWDTLCREVGKLRIRLSDPRSTVRR